MTPPGLAFVAANERARAVHKIGRPAHALLGLDLPRGRDPLPEILRHAAGAPAVRPAQGHRHAQGGGPATHAIRRHALLAEATRAAVAKWAEGQVLAFNIANPAERANSITCVLMQGRDPRAAARLHAATSAAWCWASAWASSSGKAFRIAHMGHTNAPMVLGTLGAVEMGLKALGIPHGSRRRAGGGGVSGARGGGVRKVFYSQLGIVWRGELRQRITSDSIV